MIEGYPETVTVTPGDTLILCVSTDHPRFRVEFYRQGANLDFMDSNEWQNGAAFVRGAADQDWGWGRHEFTVPADWPSGVYIAMFFELDGQGNVVSAPDDTTIADGRSAKALFVMRSAAPGQTAPILYKVPVFTYQAYNDTNAPVSNHDGGSLYTFVDPDHQAGQVTLRRTGGGTGNLLPHPDILAPDEYDNFSPCNTFAHWDVPFIRWLEQNGYSVDYCTDLDIHENPGNVLASYRLLLSVGHDEYWSADMLANVSGFIQGGGNVALFSGNICYWRTTLKENNTAIYVDKYENGENGVYPDLWGDDGTRLAGVSYNNAGGQMGGGRYAIGYSVQQADHWVFAGTGLQDGDTFGAEERLVGYECDGALVSDQPDGSVALSPDAFAHGTPASFVILGFAKIGPWSNLPQHDVHPAATATMGVYTNTGTVFTAATVDWARVLAGGQTAVDQITRNVIERLQRPDLGIGEGVIQGHVTDLAGDPIHDASVLVGSTQLATDPQGFYTLTVDAGIYAVTAVQSGFVPMHARVRVYALATTTQDFVLVPGEAFTPAGSSIQHTVPPVGDRPRGKLCVEFFRECRDATLHFFSENFFSSLPQKIAFPS